MKIIDFQFERGTLWSFLLKAVSVTIPITFRFTSMTDVRVIGFLFYRLLEMYSAFIFKPLFFFCINILIQPRVDNKWFLYHRAPLSSHLIIPKKVDDLEPRPYSFLSNELMAKSCPCNWLKSTFRELLANHDVHTQAHQCLLKGSFTSHTKNTFWRKLMVKPPLR